MLSEEQAARDASAASHLAGLGSRPQSSLDRAVSFGSNQRSEHANSFHGDADDEESEEEVDDLVDSRFTNEETHAPRQILSPGQKLKASWVKFSDRVSSFLSRLRKVIFFWRKSQPVPHFSDASNMNHQLEALLEHIGNIDAEDHDPKQLTARFASIIKGREIKNPWNFYKQTTGAKYVVNRKASYNELNRELIALLDEHITLAKFAMTTYTATEERLKRSVLALDDFLRQTVDSNFDMEKLANQFRKYSNSLPVNDLAIAHPYQLTFLHMFGEGHITKPVVKYDDEDRRIKLDELSEDFHLKVAYGMKAAEWGLSTRKTEAIITEFPNIEKALKDLYTVQDVSAFKKISRKTVLPEYYQQLKHQADVELERAHGVLMRSFGTEEEANIVFSKIYQSTLAEGPLADKKGSPLVWKLLPLLEPAGHGRSLRTITNMNALMKSRGLIPQMDFVEKYYEIITPAATALADHYRSTQGLRAVRNLFTHTINDLSDIKKSHSGLTAN